MQDLIRVGIADSAEQPRVRQRPFQRVALEPQPGRECRQPTRERVDAAGIEIVQAVDAAHESQRRAPPGSRLGEDQRAGRELEGRESLARGAGPARRPAEPPRNHQVKHREHVMVECPDDPFADPIQTGDGVPFDGAERRVDRPEEERRFESNAIEPLSDDARGERVKVEEDVGQFWHGGGVPTPDGVPAQPRFCSRSGRRSSGPPTRGPPTAARDRAGAARRARARTQGRRRPPAARTGANGWPRAGASTRAPARSRAQTLAPARGASSG